MKEIYPQSIPMLKNAFFVNFLGLSQKHAEKKLQRGILENMKEFVLEMGKDFPFAGSEYPLQVGNEADRSMAEYAMSRSRSPTIIAEYQ
ncbi:hypothetical protein Barb6_00556 [Bacteroidales bacterium Barb6]|nr:hypothetical protein Barb6_00556 [Bacteroidales bacterium Barb6]